MHPYPGTDPFALMDHLEVEHGALYETLESFDADMLRRYHRSLHAAQPQGEPWT